MTKVSNIGLLCVELATPVWKRVLAAANWCEQSDEEFSKQAVLERLDEIEIAMQEEEANEE